MGRFGGDKEEEETREEQCECMENQRRLISKSNAIEEVVRSMPLQVRLTIDCCATIKKINDIKPFALDRTRKHIVQMKSIYQNRDNEKQ